MSSRARQALRLLLVLALLGLPSLALGGPAQATHFRANQITWERTAPDAADITVTGSWRSSFFFAPDTPPVPGDVFYPGCLDYGDGSGDCPAFEVTQVDAANDVVSGEALVGHVWPGPGPWTLSLQSCCRLSPPSHVNNGDGEVRVASLVDLAATSSSPVSLVSPIVDCARDAVCSFRVPAVDDDAGQQRYRLATDLEAAGFPGGFVQPGPPFAPSAAAIDPATGLYTWDTRGARLSEGEDTFYSTQVVVEDVVGGRVVATTPVDFFVRIGGTPNAAPSFDPPTPPDGALFEAAVGQTVVFDLAASDPDAADVVSFDLLGLPEGVVVDGTDGNPASLRVAFTPERAGDSILTVTARDQRGLGATQRSYLLRAVRSATTVTASPALAEVQPTAVHAPQLTAVLRRADGTPVAGGRVDFLAGSTTVCTALTGADGRAACGGPLQVPGVVLARGYRAVFAGDTALLPSSGGGPLLRVLGQPVT